MFETHEERLRGLIERAETPVLGLLGGLVPTDARAAIRADLKVTPSARGFAQRLEQFPALFGVWLAEHVMLGLGQDGHFSLYPHLQSAIGGVNELSPNDRELLWRTFRRAMFKLGIQPLTRFSGSNYMVDEYVRQAGVPIAFADDLAARMIQVARRLGLPDDDDQEGLLTWQSALLNKLAPPFSVTARKAVERDLQAYYTRAFLRVYANGGQATTQDALELALAKAFSREGTPASIRRAAIPQLLYRDGALGILFPPTSYPAAYQLTCGQKVHTVRMDEQGGFRALPMGLQQEVSVQRDDGERVLFAKLWPDSLSNRLLIFNAEGRLRALAQLAQDEPVELTPGRFVALCRFGPTNTDEWDEVCEDPRLIEVPLEVRPGKEVVLQNGPARVCIVGHNQPTFTLTGTVKGSLERIEFWYAGLSTSVEVPADWRQGGTQRYEIRVSAGDESRTASVTLDEEGSARVNLDRAIADLGLQTGIRRLVIALARAGDGRTLQRQSVLFWVGLKTASYGLRFSYSGRPQNLLVGSCAGLKVSNDVAEPADNHSRVVRLAFDVGHGRLVHLSWYRPGVFVEVQIPGKDGSYATLSRPLGATESVSLTSAKNIIVSASEPGFVCLGSMRTFVDFGQRPSKVFPASFLASRLEPGARTLIYQTRVGGAETPLLVLSQPHVATEVVTTRLANLFEIRVTVSGEPTDVAVTGRELATAREARAEHELLAGIWHQNDLARMQVYSTPAGSMHAIYVLIDIETLKPGVWTIGFGARVGGVWGRLEDAEEGRIVVAFAVNELGKEVQGQRVVSGAAALEMGTVVSSLGRLNEHFRQFWSPACWEQQGWLGNYFGALVERLRDHEPEFVTELADMAMVRSADDVRQGFIAKQSVPALLNRIFALPRATYKRVNSRAHPLSIALRAMPELKGSVTPAFGALIHPTAAAAFKNIAEVMQGRRPRQFQMERYVQALVQIQTVGAYQLEDELFLPREGELLGPLHLAHAWQGLTSGMAASRLMPTPRKSAAVSVARLLHRKQAVFDQAAPQGLRGHALVLRSHKPNLAELDESQQEMHENMERVANACAWLAWHCRLEVRREGTLISFHSTLAALRHQVEVSGPSVSDCIAFYLHVAPAMFAYYLLLWELVLTVELDPIVQNV